MRDDPDAGELAGDFERGVAAAVVDHDDFHVRAGVAHHARKAGPEKPLAIPVEDQDGHQLPVPIRCVGAGHRDVPMIRVTCHGFGNGCGYFVRSKL